MLTPYNIVYEIAIWYINSNTSTFLNIHFRLDTKFYANYALNPNDKPMMLHGFLIGFFFGKNERNLLKRKGQNEEKILPTNYTIKVDSIIQFIPFYLNRWK